jgi:tetratricopeptide (TPR) repeat protein
MNSLPPSTMALEKEYADAAPLASDRAKRRVVLWVCVLLAAGVAVVYWPVIRHQFINYDEPDYVTGNLHVQAGLTWPGIVWAFTTGHANNWHPLTWLSHMLDCQLFGMNAGAHHLTSALIHIANTLLLFVALWRMTRLHPTPARQAKLNKGTTTNTTWRCAMVAALFGLHPLHVESVAWVSERKDVLSTCFFMLTILCYSFYAARIQEAAVANDEIRIPKPEGSPKSEGGSSGNAEQAPMRAVSRTRRAVASRQRRVTFHALRFYLLSLFFFACGLMSKPMLVTMPFVLLLLDFWPLQRFAMENQKKTPNSDESHADTLGAGIENRKSKIEKLLWEKLPFLALAVASAVVTWWAQGRDGNIASLDTVPLGLRIENALVSYAMYLKKMLWPADLAVFYPRPGSIKLQTALAAALLLILITVLALALARRRPYLAVGWFWYVGTLVPVIGLVQVGSQAMADRYTYIPLIGIFLAVTWGLSDLARDWRHRRMILASASIAVLAICGTLTAAQLRLWQDSETLFRHALSVTTNNVTAELNLGSALYEKGKADEAADHFARALSIKPGYAEAQSNLGFTLAAKGSFAKAIEYYRAALRTRPRLAQTHWLLGSALSAEGERTEAVWEYETAIELNPDHAPALNDLAWLRASAADPILRNGAEAVTLAERACRLTKFSQAQLVGTLAAAYAEAGRFDDAVKTATKAKELATATGQEVLAEKNRQLLELYRTGKPYHEELPPTKNGN